MLYNQCCIKISNFIQQFAFSVIIKYILQNILYAAIVDALAHKQQWLNVCLTGGLNGNKNNSIVFICYTLHTILQTQNVHYSLPAGL